MNPITEILIFLFDKVPLGPAAPYVLGAILRRKPRKIEERKDG